MTYQPIIGLEVHVELATKSKMFCGCPADHFGKKPNTQTCPVCLGLPGALPVPNKKAVEWTILLGIALNCQIPQESKFDRKNYFYPDLPKGYQISQYDMPLCVEGKLKVRGDETREIRIRRVHLEEDTGKLQHAVVNGEKVSLVDFNRSGVPLVEIVTEPDFRNIDEVDLFLKKLQKIIRYLGISGADMEKGSMRIEPSISILRTQNAELNDQKKLKLPEYRVELKNINSFRFARKALEYEIKRQSEMLEEGKMPTQQTRGWSEEKNATIPQREKEGAHDYRYFPEPDIPPMRWEASQISELRTQIPELPDKKKGRFLKEYALSEYDAMIITETKEMAEYFEEATKVAQALKKETITPKMVANWLINKHIDIATILPAQFIQQIIGATKVVSISQGDLENVVKQVISENPKAVSDYKNGKVQALMFLVGKTMSILKGKGTASQVTLAIKKFIS